MFYNRNKLTNQLIRKTAKNYSNIKLINTNSFLSLNKFDTFSNPQYSSFGNQRSVSDNTGNFHDTYNRYFQYLQEQCQLEYDITTTETEPKFTATRYSQTRLRFAATGTVRKNSAKCEKVQAKYVTGMRSDSLQRV